MNNFNSKLDFFEDLSAQENIDEKRKLIYEIVDTLDSNQLTEVIRVLSEPYFNNKLKDYVIDNELPPADSIEFLFLIQAQKYNGNIVRKKMNEVGISDYYLKKFIRKYELREISSGIYIFQSKPIDGPFLFQLQYSKAVISHETALYYLDLTDVIPKRTIMSMPKKYKLSQIYTTKNSNGYYKKSYSVFDDYKEKEEVIVEYYENDPILVVNNDLISAAQKTQKNSTDNNPLFITTPERTISDVLKTTAHTEEEVKVEAIKRYFDRYPNNATRLRRTAKQQNVLSKLDEYLWKLRLD